MEFKMRLYRIDQMLHDRGAVTFGELQKALQCSAPTLKRDLQYMRTRLNAPIVYSRKANVYTYESDIKNEKPVLPLPSAWYSSTEVYALLVALDLFDRVKNEKSGLLKNEMSAIRTRLMSLVQDNKEQARELMKRLRVVLPHISSVDSSWFELIGGALAQRKRLSILYFSQSKETESIREVSPLRLVNYKGRWYLDAWCHTAKALRTFSLTRIRNVEVLPTQCESVAMRDVAKELDSSYGLFSGGTVKWAHITVDATMAIFVKDEIWHPEQKLKFHPDGTITLEVPYSRDDELIGRVLELGEHACITAPADLVQSMKRTVAAIADRYARSQSKKDSASCQST